MSRKEEEGFFQPVLGRPAKARERLLGLAVGDYLSEGILLTDAARRKARQRAWTAAHRAGIKVRIRFMSNGEMRIYRE